MEKPVSRATEPQNDPARLRQAGEIHKKIMTGVTRIIQEDFAGMITADVNEYIDDQIAKAGMEAAFKTVPGYDYASCISVNNIVVHGTPNDTPLLAGDHVTVDFGVSNDGYIVDAADSWIVGKKEKDDLIQAAYDVRAAMVDAVVVGAKAMDLALAAQPLAKELAKSNIYILGDFTGHGISRNNLHTTPCIPCVPVNTKMPTKDFEHQCLRERYRLRDGDCIAIEPVLVKTNKNPKKGLRITVQQDGWTIRLDDKDAIAVHCEHTLLVTRGKPEILA